jgi:hypothetical protein
LVLFNFMSHFRASLRDGNQRDATATAVEGFNLPFIRTVFARFFLSSTPQITVPPSIAIAGDLTHSHLTQLAGRKISTLLVLRAAFKIGAANHRLCLLSRTS